MDGETRKESEKDKGTRKNQGTESQAQRQLQTGVSTTSKQAGQQSQGAGGPEKAVRMWQYQVVPSSKKEWVYFEIEGILQGCQIVVS